MLLKTKVKNILKDEYLYDRITQNSGMVTVVFYCKISEEDAKGMINLIRDNIFGEHDIYDIIIDIFYYDDIGYTYMWVWKDKDTMRGSDCIVRSFIYFCKGVKV
jgi:hypothetical protein